MPTSPAEPTPARNVYHIDILSTVIHHLPWKDLIGGYAVDATLGALVVPEIRRRVFAVVSHFVAEEHVQEFFDILRDSDGLICGSTVRHLLLPYNPHSENQLFPETTPFPRDLNILVAHDRSELFFSFFGRLSYNYAVEAPDTLYSDQVTKLEVFRLPRQDGTEACITLSLCKENPLSALITSPTTAEMNAITSDAIYSLYPRLTYANEGIIATRITAAGTKPDELRVGGGVMLFSNNAHWTKACGAHCPMRRRKTYDDEGVARYRWSPSNDELTVYNEWGNVVGLEPARAMVSEWDLMYSDMKTWQILDRCVNPQCADAEKYDRRSRYTIV